MHSQILAKSQRCRKVVFCSTQEWFQGSYTTLDPPTLRLSWVALTLATQVRLNLPNSNTLTRLDLNVPLSCLGCKPKMALGHDSIAWR